MTQVEEFGTPKAKPEQRNIKKTAFLNLTNSAVVRILSRNYTVVDTHYINGATVMCLGEDCPICNTNKSIIIQNPETFREDPRYIPKRKVYMVNVLDKTPVRTCPSCGVEVHGQSPSQVCPKCNAILSAVEVKPSNKVKVLSKGVTLFEHLGAINNAILDEHGEKIGLTGYDVTLMVAGAGKDRTITPIPGTPTGEIDTSGLELFNLDEVVIKLAATEMLDLQRGVSLRDIFAARRSAVATDDFTRSVMGSDQFEEVKSSVDELFGTAQ